MYDGLTTFVERLSQVTMITTSAGQVDDAYVAVLTAID